MWRNKIMQTAMNDLLMELNEQDGSNVQGGWDFGFATWGYKTAAAEILAKTYKNGKPPTQKEFLDFYIGEKEWLNDADETPVKVGSGGFEFGTFSFNF
jgi:hypothetical protein